MALRFSFVPILGANQDIFLLDTGTVAATMSIAPVNEYVIGADPVNMIMSVSPVNEYVLTGIPPSERSQHPFAAHSARGRGWAFDVLDFAA